MARHRQSPPGSDERLEHEDKDAVLQDLLPEHVLLQSRVGQSTADVFQQFGPFPGSKLEKAQQHPALKRNVESKPRNMVGFIYHPVEALNQTSGLWPRRGVNLKKSSPVCNILAAACAGNLCC